MDKSLPPEFLKRQRHSTYGAKSFESMGKDISFSTNLKGKGGMGSTHNALYSATNIFKYFYLC